MGAAQVVLDAEAIERVVRRLAVSLVDELRGTGSLGLVGIRRGGVPLAALLGTQIEALEGRAVPLGAVDITLHRDDAATARPNPRIGPSEVPFPVAGMDVVLVDDVLQTGRTVRAAIDCLMLYGRPRRIWLAVLCDRGGRELPIAPDFVGRVLEVPSDAVLDVRLSGTDKAVLRGTRYESRYPPKGGETT